MGYFLGDKGSLSVYTTTAENLNYSDAAQSASYLTVPCLPQHSIHNSHAGVKRHS